MGVDKDDRLVANVERMIEKLMGPKAPEYSRIDAVARVLVERGRLDLALPLWERSAELAGPGSFSSKVYNRVGAELQKADRSEEALEFLRRSVSIEGGGPSPWENIAIVLGELGRYQECADAYADAEVAGVETSLCIYERAWAFCKLSLWNECVSECKRLTSTDLRSLQARCLQVVGLTMLKETDSIREILTSIKAGILELPEASPVENVDALLGMAVSVGSTGSVRFCARGMCKDVAKCQCGVCKSASYCSVECQKRHYNIHKKDCKTTNTD